MNSARQQTYYGRRFTNVKPLNKRQFLYVAMVGMALVPNLGGAEERKLDMSSEPIWPQEIRRVDPHDQDLERIAPSRSSQQPSGNYPLTLLPDGSLRVLDGGSFSYKGIRYRLSGIRPLSALQLCKRSDGKRWTCGLRARILLRQLVSRSAACRIEAELVDETTVQCRTGDGDLAAEIVLAGLAKAAPGSAYAAQEQAARVRRAGLWSGGH